MSGFSKTFTLPFESKIPSYTDDFLRNASLLKFKLKYFRRQIYLTYKKQKSLEIHSILPKHQKILWINLSAPSLGDSLMDLSSRILLHNKQVELFTNVKNASLYQHDKIFKAVFTKKEELINFKYDLIIVDSFSTRSICIKHQIAPRTNYVGMFGLFNGPEVNRVLFSFNRMNQLLGQIHNKDELNDIAKCTIAISKSDKRIIDNLGLPSSYIAISIGGEWQHRTYQNWQNIITGIVELGLDTPIVLVGSKNAEVTAREITQMHSSVNIINCVNKCSFNQTSEIIKRAKVFLCCDGGLMHAANAVNTPIIVMLARLSAKMQLTKPINAEILYDEKDVNNIMSKDFLLSYKKFIKFDSNAT